MDPSSQGQRGDLYPCGPKIHSTSTKADIFVRLRSGTDIAFLGGMIKYILDNNLYDEFYVKNYTMLPSS